MSLASVAPSVWHDRGGGHAGARPRGPEDPGPVPSQVEVRRAAQKAVALAQQDKSTWTRADLIKYLGRVLPGPAWTRVRPPRCWRIWRTAR